MPTFLWLGLGLLALPVVLFGYAYLGYPALLWLLTRRQRPALTQGAWEWPSITITIPVYNEEARIAAALDRVLALDYPADRRDVLVISDASTDGTDAVVERYADRGVRLLRLPERGGKTAAENAAALHLLGQIVVNIDATAAPRTDALLALVSAFQDPAVGVASGRDISVGENDEQNKGESNYVGYEMWLRSLETRFGSIVGASGCFFATRVDLQDPAFPPELSRDFASALIASEAGFRAVSVDGAVCAVPRTHSLQREFYRKVRTMARGLRTLWCLRRMLNPARYGRFAFMLWSHKLLRWLVPLTAPLALIGLVLLALSMPLLWLAVGAVVTVVLTGLVALIASDERPLPTPVAAAGYLVGSTLAGVLAWWQFLSGERTAVWDPTPRATSDRTSHRVTAT